MRSAIGKRWRVTTVPFLVLLFHLSGPQAENRCAASMGGPDTLSTTSTIERSNIIYVDDDAIGANNGTSWEDAYIYLQDALSDANDSDTHVEIRVAQGIYKPDRGANWTPGNREAAFRLISGVALMGGYAGSNEADPNARDIDLYETVLSGDLNGDDDISQLGYSAQQLIDRCRIGEFVEAREEFAVYLRNTAHAAENSCSVVTAFQVNETAVLDGFTITGGNSYESSYRALGRSYGAGIKIERASAIIRDCTVKYNVAGYSGGGLSSENSWATICRCQFELNFSGRDGGGLWHEHGSPVITECTFIRNYAPDDAGGVYFSYEGEPALENCHIESNVAGDDGGGIYCSRGWGGTEQCAPLIKGNTIIGNIALNGGGIACKKHPVPVIVDNLIKANRALDDGGGMYLRYSECSVVGNRIKENFAADDGGGIYLKTDDDYFGRVADSYFTSNDVIGNSALDNGGGIYCQNVSPNIDNCVIALNFAEDGAGLWSRSHATDSDIFSRPVLRNVTMAENFAAEIGGAICCRWGSTVTVVDSIIWENTTPSRNQIAVLDNSRLTIENSCLNNGFPGSGNISSDPLLFNEGNRDNNGTVLDPNDDILVEGDYHLMSEAGRWDPESQSWIQDCLTSPCIDTGDPNHPLVYEPFPNGGIVNMGAYGGTAEASKSPSGHNFE